MKIKDRFRPNVYEFEEIELIREYRYNVHKTVVLSDIKIQNMPYIVLSDVMDQVTGTERNKNYTFYFKFIDKYDGFVYFKRTCKDGYVNTLNHCNYGPSKIYNDRTWFHINGGECKNVDDFIKKTCLPKEANPMLIKLKYG